MEVADKRIFNQSKNNQPKTQKPLFQKEAMMLYQNKIITRENHSEKEFKIREERKAVMDE